jgi:hypothetical protein
MSSILEALKKLEAEKNAQVVPVDSPEPAYSADLAAGALLGPISHGHPAAHRLAPLTLLLAGGFFTILLVGVSVLLSLLVMQRGQIAQPPSTPPSPASGEPAAAAMAPVPSALSDPAQGLVTTPVATEHLAPSEKVATTQAPASVDERPRKAPAPRRETPAALPVEEVRYEPYIPKPAKSEPRKSEPLPDDIRSLPMLSRTERAQYRLEDMSLNMLNEANAQRPTGNAIINLEKVFVGETLPGSNAKLVDVRSHGIAVEILSTRQRYYIPR